MPDLKDITVAAMNTMYSTMESKLCCSNLWQVQAMNCKLCLSNLYVEVYIDFFLTNNMSCI